MSLPRHTELRRTTPMPRPTKPIARTEFRRAAPRATRTAPGRGKAQPAREVPGPLRSLVVARDLDRCVRCGIHTAGIARSVQHRQARGMGGRLGAHTSANLIVLCGTGTTDCHGWVEDRANWNMASDLGWAVSSFAPDPAAIPVLVQWLGWCWPGDEWIPLQEGEHGLCQA